ncbi:endonuclease/exonuclease/phosphatase family protein [Glycomyces tarimensis]
MVAPEDRLEPDRDTPLIGPARGPRIHVMTYNLRAATGTAPHSWGKRRPLVRTLLRRERPTVLCTQEGRFRQILDLKADLDGYDCVHLGRGGGSRSEATAIFWDERRLTPVEYDHLWVSRRPHVIGSRSWGSHTVRMLTWVRFRDLETGKEFHVVDNHLDHRSERARRKGAELNLRVIADFGSPTIVAGDFNCNPDSKAYEILVRGGLIDAWDVADERLTPAWNTFNGWRPGPVEGSRRIDWILVQQGLAVHRAAVNSFAEDGLTPSDHWPVQALVSLR